VHVKQRLKPEAVIKDLRSFLSAAVMELRLVIYIISFYNVADKQNRG